MARSQAIKCGVIGYGGAFNMGKSHLDQMAAAGMIPTAVCELDRTRLEVASRDFPGIGTFDSLEAMLANSPVELVTIITPHNTHAPLAIQCMNAGRHVVSEKPIAITTAEVDQMIAAAKANNVMLSAYHNRHWDGNVISAVDHIVRQRWVGDVVRIGIHWGGRAVPIDWWRSDRAYSGGVLYDWGVHLLEYALQLLPGQTITEVTGFATNGYWVKRASEFKLWHRDPIEDEARLIARTNAGVAIDLTVTQLDVVGKQHMFEVVGTDGHYSMTFPTWTRTSVRPDGVKVAETGNQPPGEQYRYYQNVADHLMHDAPLVITAEYARRMVHMLDLGVQSAKQGRALPAIYG